MGALPKRRISTHRQGRRRASIRLGRVSLVNCRHCGEKKRPHHICPSCGKR